MITQEEYANARIATLETQLAEAQNAIKIHIEHTERINGDLAAEVVRLRERAEEMETHARVSDKQGLMWRDKAMAAEAQLAEANKRIVTLEAELLEASELLEKPISHGVGILCVAEAVRVVLAQLAEAEKNSRYFKGLAEQYVEGRNAAEAREAKLRGLADKLWQKINDWRCRLIQWKVAGDVPGRALAELPELQALADEYLRVIAPLPIAELKQYMREHGIEIPAQDALQPAKEEKK